MLHKSIEKIKFERILFEYIINMNLKRGIALVAVLAGSLAGCVGNYYGLEGKTIDKSLVEGVKQYLEYKDGVAKAQEREQREKLREREEREGDLLDKVYEEAVEYREMGKGYGEEHIRVREMRGFGFYDESFPFSLKDISLHSGMTFTVLENWNDLPTRFDFHLYNLYQEELREERAPSLAFDAHYTLKLDKNYSFGLFGNKFEGAIRRDFQSFRRNNRTIYSAIIGAPIDVLSFPNYNLTTSLNYSINDISEEGMKTTTFTNTWQPLKRFGIPLNINSYFVVPEKGKVVEGVRVDFVFDF